MQPSSNPYDDAEFTGLAAGDPRQGELFPFEGWPGQQIGVSLVRPHTGISRAVLVPLVDTVCTVRSAEEHAAYLLVGDDGRSVLKGVTTLARLRDPAGWARLATRLLEAHATDIMGEATGIQAPPDCRETWFSLGQWHLDCGSGRPHALVRRLTERHRHLVTSLRTGRLSDELALLEQAIASKLLRDFVAPQVEWVLQGLDPTLYTILTHRPTLSLRAASRLLSWARAHGSEAERYAVQFMRAEPIGLVNLVAFPEQVPGANSLRQALCAGHSLKPLLLSLRVGHAVHRRLLRKLDVGTVPSELPLSGPQWLQVVRLLSKLPPGRWPTSLEEWADLLRLGSLNGPQRASQATLAWAWHPDGDCLERWSALEVAANRVLSMARQRLNQFATAEAVREHIVTTIPELSDRSVADLRHALSVANIGLYAELVCRVEGASLEKTMEEAFRRIDHGPLTVQEDGYQLRLLANWREVIDQGLYMKNCLRQPRSAASYCLQPAILFALSERAGASYTVAAGFRNEPGQGWACTLEEIRAAGNGSAPEAVVQVAQELLAGLNGRWPSSFERHRMLFSEWGDRLRQVDERRPDDGC